MDIMQDLMENKLSHVDSDLKTISKQLQLIQEFIKCTFGEEFKRFLEKRAVNLNKRPITITHPSDPPEAGKDRLSKPYSNKRRKNRDEGIPIGGKSDIEEVDNVDMIPVIEKHDDFEDEQKVGGLAFAFDVPQIDPNPIENEDYPSHNFRQIYSKANETITETNTSIESCSDSANYIKIERTGDEEDSDDFEDDNVEDVDPFGDTDDRFSVPKPDLGLQASTRRARPREDKNKTITSKDPKIRPDQAHKAPNHPEQSAAPIYVDDIKKYIVTRCPTTKKYPCPVCNQICHSRGTVNRHMILHVRPDDRTFGCTLCDEKFTRRETITGHMAQHERSTRIGNPLFSCHICHKKYLRLSFYEDHMELTHPKVSDVDLK